MAKFVFGGGIERDLQVEIEKQNSKNVKKQGDFSLFKNKAVQSDDYKDRISSKKEIEDKFPNRWDEQTRLLHLFEEAGELSPEVLAEAVKAEAERQQAEEITPAVSEEVNEETAPTTEVAAPATPKKSDTVEGEVSIGEKSEESQS